MFVGIRSFFDIKEVRVMDVEVLRDSTLEVFVGRSKMDQEEVGSVFYLC